MTKTKCPLCPKTFKSRSGLRRHSNREHPVDKMTAPPHKEPVADVQDAHPASLAEHMANDNPLRDAMKALGITRANVMAYKVYPDKVVIIEGPVGWKRVSPRKES